MRVSIFFCLLFLFNFSWAETLVIPKVSVAANTSEHSHTPSNAHTIIITAKQIQQSGAQNLEQVLNGIAGIQISDLTGDGSQVSVSMRGFGANASENSLILINGMPLNNPDLQAPNLNLIPLKSIKAIEVFNGSEGVLFGDQAVGGVINIITKKPNKDSLYASMTGGSYDTSIFQEGFTIVGKHHLYSSVHVKKLKTDNYREHNQNNTQQLFGAIGQDYTKSGWNINYNIAHQLLDLAGALTAQQVVENRRQSQNNENYTDDDYSLFQLQQYHWLNQNWEEKFKAMHRNLDSHGFLFSPYADQQKENWLQLSFAGLWLHSLLTSGVAYGKSSYNLNSSISNTNDNQHRVALFAQTNTHLTKKLILIVGARSAWQHSQLSTTEVSNESHSAFVTTLGLTYRWTKYLDIFARRAGSYRFPKADENAFTANGLGGLKTQKGVSYEFGTSINQQRWSATLSAYVLNLKNEIAFDPTPLPNQPFGVNRNLDPTRRIGELLNLHYALLTNWVMGLQLAHVSAKFSEGNFKNNDIPFVANNTASLYSNYQFFTFWNLFAKINFIGPRYAVGDDANAFPKVPAETLVDLGLHYQKHWFFAVFRVNNVFNQKYNAYESVNTVSVNPLVQQQYFYPAPGRNFLLTIGFKLA